MRDTAIAANEPVWALPETIAPPVGSQPPGSCDTVVVGAGITGLTAALRLQAEGRSVALVEQTVPGGGSTGASSAHLTTLPDSGLSRIASVFSTDATRLVVGAMTGAIDQIESWSMAYSVPCRFARTSGYLFAETDSGVGEIREEAEAARAAGLKPEEVAHTPLPFPVRSAVRFEEQAFFDPAAYARGLARAFYNQGGTLLTDTRVLDFHTTGRCEVITDRGTVRARQVILATHTPIGRSTVHAEMKPMRSYLIAAELHEVPPPALFWDVASPYHYLRRVDRPEEPPLVLVGGSDHKTGEPPSGHHPCDALESWVAERFRLRRTVARWSAQYYQPVDGLPFVGRSLTGRNLFIATGFNGDGLTLGTAAGGLLADLITGRPNELEALFAPTRVKIRVAGRFAALNAKFARRLLPETDDEGPQPGTGAILASERGTSAVYRTPEGGVVSLSARCPHMGCVVQWNATEGTWDCPCHGGRFSADGCRLEGPPRSDLERIPEPARTF